MNNKQPRIHVDQVLSKTMLGFVIVINVVIFALTIYEVTP